MNLLLFIIIILSFFLFDFKKVFLIAFFFGALNDLVYGNLVGFTSFAFLLICFLVYVYRKRFSSSHILFQLSFILLADWLFTLINRETWILKSSLVLGLLSLIIFSFVNRMKGKGLEISNF